MTRLPNRMPPKKTVPQPKPVVKKPIDMVTRGESVDTLLHEFYSSFTYGSNSSIDYDKEAKKIENEINNKCDCNKIAYIDLLNKKIDQIKREDCRKWVEEKFTVERMVSEYEKIFYKIVTY